MGLSTLKSIWTRDGRKGNMGTVIAMRRAREMGMVIAMRRGREMVMVMAMRRGREIMMEMVMAMREVKMVTGVERAMEMPPVEYKCTK